MGDLTYTGERCIPGLTPEPALSEHLARYRFAQRYAFGRRVLDACCGVGYGSAMLAEVAAEVVGFDRSEEAIGYASEHYARPNLRFEVADILEWWEGDFELAVAFEALEHVEDGQHFVERLHWALRPGGQLLLSVPSWSGCWRSPFHLRCYRMEELHALLARFTGYWLGQKRDAIGLKIAPDYHLFVGERS